jgi:hypothetical protein
VNTLGKYKFTDDLRCILLIGNRRPVMDDYDFRGSIVYRFLDRSRGLVSPNLNAFALALAAIVVCALAMVAEAIPA